MGWSLDSARDFLFFLLHAFPQEREWVETGSDGEEWDGEERGGQMPSIALPSWGPSAEWLRPIPAWSSLTVPGPHHSLAHSLFQTPSDSGPQRLAPFYNPRSAERTMTDPGPRPSLGPRAGDAFALTWLTKVVFQARGKRRPFRAGLPRPWQPPGPALRLRKPASRPMLTLPGSCCVALDESLMLP